MRKVLDLYLKLEENDFRYKNDDKKRLEFMYQILRDSIMQLNVSEFTDSRVFEHGVDKLEIRKYQDQAMGSRIGVEILKAGYTEVQEMEDYRGRERRLSVLVLK